MRLNNKGQALVEFVIIAPILIFIIMSIIDVGNIVLKKMKLEDNLNTVVELYEKGNYEVISSLSNKESFNYDLNKQNNMTVITLKQDIKVNTPILNLILKDNYKIKTSRTIYDE